MNQALTYLYQIYAQFMSFLFNDFTIYIGEGHTVTFGWFMVAIFVFGVIIRNVLMLPKSASNMKFRGKENE